jgi:hypothetical protein
MTTTADRDRPRIAELPAGSDPSWPVYTLTLAEPMFDRAQVIATIETGRCACPGCRGELTVAGLSPRGWRHCQACRCAWKAEAINGTVYAISLKGPQHTPARKPLRPLTEADYDGHDDLR